MHTYNSGLSAVNGDTPELCVVDRVLPEVGRVWIQRGVGQIKTHVVMERVAA